MLDFFRRKTDEKMVDLARYVLREVQAIQSLPSFQNSFWGKGQHACLRHSPPDYSPEILWPEDLKPWCDLLYGQHFAYCVRREEIQGLYHVKYLHLTYRSFEDYPLDDRFFDNVYPWTPYAILHGKKHPYVHCKVNRERCVDLKGMWVMALTDMERVIPKASAQTHQNLDLFEAIHIYDDYPPDVGPPCARRVHDETLQQGDLSVSLGGALELVKP